ncbi:TonB-dependent receptor [Sphingomonas changnyeongensis]|uniref:TonB-dependent receptor n=1 Tax=Sphingomonas changnyeongensis TaxID=2698679 RepID=A0A7Z2NVQ2_9SPHN|nr:TonB-dependent receptor [Sphingomonas changnyeongensis]QHL90607.1 TonB-dependent receptor [Sphingomonas changnyeongensis]
MKSARFLVSSAVAALFATSPVLAQSAPAPQDNATETQEQENVADIIVTAAGRAQVVQDVPIAVSVLGGELITRGNIVDVRGIQQIAPSLQTTTGQSAATGTVLRIRGVGTAGDNPGFEPAVGVFIDGVFRARSGIALAELPQLDRVEVLRGPQGTLFGRNTSAGALNIVTAGPAFNLGGYAEVSYGNYDELEVRGGITGPVSDTLALRLDGVYHVRDGTIRDVNSDRRINNLDRYLLRGQALFENDDVRFRLIADYAKTDEQCCGAVNTNSFLQGQPVALGGPGNPAFGAAFAAASAIQQVAAAGGRTGIVTPYRPSERRMAISPNRDYLEAVKEWGVSGQLDYTLSDSLNLTSITAYRDWQVRRNQDIDFSGVDRAYREGYRNRFKNFTQELRLQGQAFDDKLDWLVGGFYLNETLTLRDTVRFGTESSQYVDGFISNLTRSATLPTGFQVFGTRAGTPLVGQVLLASNPALAAAAAAGGPAVLGTFLSPFPGTPNGGGQQADNYRVKTNAIALFTHNILSITDDLKLTLGLRYNRETKKIRADLNSTVPACSFLLNPNATLLRAGLAGLPSGLGSAITNLACNPTVNSEFNGIYNGRRTDEEFTGTAKLSYEISEAVTLYGGYDRGFKSGGFNLDRGTFDTRLLGGNGAQIDDLSFRPETVDSYEIGIKTNFSSAFTFNATLFTADFKNFQDLTFIGNNFRVTSVAKLRSRGVELESIIRPYRDLTFNLGYSYTDSQYIDDRLNAIPELAAGNRAQTTNTPRDVVTVAMNWTPQLSDSVGLSVYTDMRYSGETRTINVLGSEPFTGNPGVAIVNARVGLTFLERKLLVEAYVENLFDTYFNVTAFPIPEQSSNFAVYPNLPRFYGVRARYTF